MTVYYRGMRKTSLALLGLALVGCGGDDGGGADANTAPSTITISGQATGRSGTSSMALANVTIAAYRNSNESTPVAMATSDASGNYSMTITTEGQALDGFLKATFGGYLDTYLYPPRAVDADFDGASINMITSGTLDLLAGLLCGDDQMTTTGVIAVLVADSTDTAVAGATVGTSPAATKICYNMSGTPNRNATMTDTDGIAYAFNVTGTASVSAIKSGTDFVTHSVNARAGTFTTTVIQP
jgi:hypothetical protein